MDELNKDDFRKRKKTIQFSIDGDERVYQIADRHSYSFGRTKLTIPTPNIAGIFLNAAEKQTALAWNIYTKNIQPIFKLNEDITLREIQSAQLFTYIEHIQIAVIMLYTAIESLVNTLIPQDYLYHEEKNGGSLLMDKPYIERNKSTDFKLSTILPEALEIKSPKTSNHWSSFKKLEGIRNNIIHLKTEALSEADMDKNLMYSLLKPSIFKIIQSTQKLIAELATTVDDGYNAPVLKEKDAIFSMIFEDWELMEEYFIAKGILPALDKEEKDETKKKP
jgi:hypothetical protein